MPVTAPHRRILPERRPERQPEKSTRARCASRLAVITDKGLSHGAARLYVLLDDYAGAKGVCWPKQATLAHRLGASRQSVQRWIAELERAGWLAIERTGRAHRYTLKWASGSQAGGHRIPICKPVVIQQPQPVEPEAVTVAEEMPDTGEDCAQVRKTCEHFHGEGKPEYVVPSTLNCSGRRISERRWKGICGCRQ